MTSILIVEHSGIIKQVKVKDLSMDTLYKKCGFKTNDNFNRVTTWSVEYNKDTINIELWAKDEGKANNENKYDFPPPVDNELYYGSCVLLRIDNDGKVISLTNDIWLYIYDRLFEGFESTSIDEENEDDDDEDDDDDGDDDDDDNDDDDDEDVKINNINNEYSKESSVVKKEKSVSIINDIESELEEEAYSDEN